MVKYFAALIMLVLALAACGPQSAQTLPTLIATPGGVEPATATSEVVEPTVPPTSEPQTRPTLPPTWTPDAGVDLSASPTPESLNPPQQFPTELPTLVVCGTFLANRSQSTTTFTLGTQPQIMWTNVATAARYRIRLLDSTGAELFVDFTLQPGYAFRADLFERGKVYAWSVYPEDSIGQQMCTERGAELLPE